MVVQSARKTQGSFRESADSADSSDGNDSADSNNADRHARVLTDTALTNVVLVVRFGEASNGSIQPIGTRRFVRFR